MINFSKITTWLLLFLILFFFVAGFFTYQWWQVKGELAKKIEQNENLIKQIDELQKEIEELRAAEGKILDEAAEWKTYRNEEYGFEIDYPAVGWEFDGDSLCKLKIERQEDKEKFCIYIDIEYLYPYCYNCSWKEIFARDDICEEIYSEEEFLERMKKSCHCLFERSYGGEFEKEITTNSGVKGYKGKMTMPYAEGCYSYNEVIVYFPFKEEIKLREKDFLPLVAWHYFNCPKYFNFGQEEIEVFNKIVSSFRFIEN